MASNHPRPPAASSPSKMQQRRESRVFPTSDKCAMRKQVQNQLSSLAHKMSSICENLRNQLAICYQSEDERRQREPYQNLVRLFETVNIDNMKIQRALIYAKDDDPPPLIDGSNKTMASVEVLRGKHVLLLISDLDLSEEEIFIIDYLYKDARSRIETPYEVVWIPVVDRVAWNDLARQKFEHLRSLMSWYIVRDPLTIEPSVIKYIREVWNFTKKAILVALGPQGRVSSPNALHMYWIWGNLAFPFTREKEESLWKEEVWSLVLLVDGIDPAIMQWIEENKHICLYGGEDLEWIEAFTSNARAAAQAGNFSLEMVYMGKNTAKERMQRMINTFTTRRFSYFWPNVTSIWFFWTRLESMLYSKRQHGANVESDQIMIEVTTLLSFDSNDQGWAIFYRGAQEMAKCKGDGFIPAVNDYLSQIRPTPHRNRLILPSNIAVIPENVMCATCGRRMEKFIMYRCCVDEEGNRTV